MQLLQQHQKRAMEQDGWHSSPLCQLSADQRNEGLKGWDLNGHQRPSKRDDLFVRPKCKFGLRFGKEHHLVWDTGRSLPFSEMISAVSSVI